MKIIGKVAFLIFFLFSTSSFADDVIKACGHHDYAPWNWLEDGKIIGACADIASQLYAKIGYKLDLTYVGPWARCQKLISEGKVDVNICSVKNSPREKYSAFTQTPIAKNEQAIFVKSSAPFTFTHLEDLKQKTLGLVRGVSLGNEIDSFLNNHTKVFYVSDYSSLFQMLQLDRIDGVIVARESGKRYVKANELSDKVIDLATPLAVVDLYMSISKQSKFLDTLALVDPIIQSNDYSSWYKVLLSKYSEVLIKPKSTKSHLELDADNKNTEHAKGQLDKHNTRNFLLSFD